MTNYIIKIKDDELYHHGIKGQKWGVRRQQKKQAKKDFANMPSKKRGPVDAGNSAARSYFNSQTLIRKADRTRSFAKYRKLNKKAHRLQRLADRKTARLNEAQVKAGRYRIARNRNYRRTALSAVIGTAAGVAAMGLGAAALGVPVAGAAYITSRYASGGRRYRREQISYKKFATKESKPIKKNKSKSSK